MTAGFIQAGRSPANYLASFIIALLVAAGLSQAGLAQDRQVVAGTIVSLVPPTGFTPAPNFAGLVNQETKASVVVVEMPAIAHAQVSTLFADLDTARTNFAKQNVVVAGIEQIEVAGGGKVPLISGTQNAGGISFDKWVALFNGPKTVLVTVQSPQGAGLDRKDVQALLASVAFGSEPSMAEKLAALPFVIRAAEPFRVVDTIGGSSVLMTVGPLDTDPAGSQPLLIVAYQLSAPIAPDRLDVAAEALLKQTRDFQTARIDTREGIRFAGTNGVLLGGVHDHTSGNAKRFAQYMAIGSDGRFVRMIVTADEATFATLGPAITAIADSIAFAAAK